MASRYEREHLSAKEIGLGPGVQAVLFLISIFPFVGIVIGANYMVRDNAATRQLGQRLLMFASGIHFFYLCILCPILSVVFIL